MSKLNLEEIKDKLITEKESLLRKLSNKNLSIDDSEMPDPVDLAVTNYSKNVMLSVSENESRQLMLINDALERIEDGEYGLCQNCEEEIVEKRLNAVPWAKYCLACQELDERGLLDEE
ncbi:MAG: TraR/DksA C4-type zinc finger protein [Acidobacteriota bacterium]|jgi:DnaK suppressor protein|nr:TraR/DksA C4-type zinc finger protein [Acidobacteriota bacterium]